MNLYFSGTKTFIADNIAGDSTSSGDEDTLKILSNKKVIEINQDEAVRQPFIIQDNQWHKILGRHLSNGDIAILVINTTEEVATNLSFNLDLLGLNRVTGKTLWVKDTSSDIKWKITNGVFDISPFKLKGHSTKLFRAKVIDL